MNANKARLCIIFSMVLFGAIGLLVKNIPFPSSVIAMARGLIGALFLILVSLIRRKPVNLKAIKKSLFRLIISGALIGVNWIFLFESYNYTTLATATLCYYFAPVIVVLASPLLKEKLGLRKIICAAFAVLGMAFVSGVVQNGLPSFGELQGVLLALGAAAMYAGVVLINKTISGIPALDRTTVQIATAGIVIIPYTLLTAKVDSSMFTAKTIILLLVVCIIFTGVAYLVYFSTMEYLSGQSVSMMAYIDPVVSVLCSVFILKEGFNIYSFIGAVLILGSAIVSEINFTKKTA